MTYRGGPVIAAVVLLGACASRKDESKPENDPFFALQFVPAAAEATADFPPAGQAEAFTLEVLLERANGSRLTAPRITAYANQVANISMLNQTPYAAGTESGDTAIKTVESGLRLDVAMSRAADGGVTVGYSLHLSRLSGPLAESETTGVGGAVVRPRMPEIERVEVAGARWLEPGAQGLLARISSPDGSGPMLVLARVRPVRIDPPPASVPAENFGDPRLLRPMSGHTLHLRLTASKVGREIDPGTVIDETAAPDVLKAAGGEVLRDFEIYSCIDSRVRVAGLLDGHGGTRGLVAEGRDDGKLDLSWTTTGDTHRATVRPNAGRRFVALARIEGGGTAGVIVSVDSD